MEAAKFHVRRDSAVTRFYHRVAERRGRKAGLVDAGRELAAVCYSVLVNCRPHFDPLRSQAWTSLRGSTDPWSRGRARDWGCLVASSYYSGVSVTGACKHFHGGREGIYTTSYRLRTNFQSNSWIIRYIQISAGTIQAISTPSSQV